MSVKDELKEIQKEHERLEGVWNLAELGKQLGYSRFRLRHKKTDQKELREKLRFFAALIIKEFKRKEK